MIPLMKRRLFTILSALSLLLCVATAALCLRSYWVDDFVSQMIPHQKDPNFYELWGQSVYGSVYLTYLTTSEPPMSGPASLRLSYYRSPSSETQVPRDTPARRWGFGYADHYQSETVWLPHWVIVLSTAVLPVMCLTSQARARKRRRRLTLGLCPNCGYDLRASPERCPECGEAIPADMERKPVL